MYTDEIYENHLDLFGNDVNLDLLAAHVMGREMSKIAKLNTDLYTRIQNLLESNTISAASSEAAKIMAEFFENTLQENVDKLNALKSGFTE